MPENDLQQLGVLVTRPAHQAEGLCQLIEQAGGRAVRFPTLAIKPVEDSAVPQQLLARLGEMDMAIFISPNAVSQTKQLLPAGLPANLQVATVGTGTARQLDSDFGRQPDIVPAAGFNSEALLAMPALQDVASKQIMILRGDGGRPLLGDTLRDRGATVIYATVYIRSMPEISADELEHTIQEQNIDIIVITSGEGLNNLLHMAGETYLQGLCNMTLVLPNLRLKSMAEERGFNGELLIAGGNRDEDILTCLQQHVRQQ